MASGTGMNWRKWGNGPDWYLVGGEAVAATAAWQHGLRKPKTRGIIGSFLGFGSALAMCMFG